MKKEAMNKIFINDCAADNCYSENLGNGKQMCEKHQGMYEEGIPFKGFYGKTVLKKEFQKNNR